MVRRLKPLHQDLEQGGELPVQFCIEPPELPCLVSACLRLMKKSSYIVLGAVGAVFALAACETTNSRTPTNRFGYRGSHISSTTQFATPTPTPEGYTEDGEVLQEFAPPTPTPTPFAPPVPSTPSYSYGTPVPGKLGFVTSPHSPYAGYVDVRGFPPGTEVKCPYSGKIFLVP